MYLYNPISILKDNGIMLSSRLIYPYIATINTQRSDLNITISQEIVDADLISILVQQTALCIESLSVFDRINQDLQPVFRLFRAMMAHRPDLIQDEHSGHLWAHLCGETSRDPQVRNCSFNFFAEFLGSLSGGEEGQVSKSHHYGTSVANFESLSMTFK